jgi:hypothetical protein
MSTPNCNQLTPNIPFPERGRQIYGEVVAG